MSEDFITTLMGEDDVVDGAEEMSSYNFILVKSPNVERREPSKSSLSRAFDLEAILKMPIEDFAELVLMLGKH